jgi:alkanesulfonate monooxygenase SsuD/methylene tetrahydromethanopterin reductase-like flavin-dependent oxidoreductase (luciferase family)
MEFGSFMEFHSREGMGQATAFEESFGHADLAENLGLDAVWMAEIHFNPVRSMLASPLVLASAIAARTNRLKVGTAVHVLPLGNPLRIAEEAATLDHVSRGRFEFGVGRSGLPGSYEGYNMPYGESRERFFEYLDIILTAWKSERFSYEGKFFSFSDVCLTPKPYQTPHPPIRIAATTPDTFPILAGMGFPIFIGLRTVAIDKVVEEVGIYKQRWEESDSRGPMDVSLRVPVYVADTKEKALTEPEESFMSQFRGLSGQFAKSAAGFDSRQNEDRARRGQQLATVTWEQAQRDKVIVGTPEMVIDRIHEWKEIFHLSGVVGEFNAGGRIPKEHLHRSLQLFCEKVMPEFK